MKPNEVKENYIDEEETREWFGDLLRQADELDEELYYDNRPCEPEDDWLNCVRD